MRILSVLLLLISSAIAQTNVEIGTLNGTWLADQQPGADACAKIDKAFQACHLVNTYCYVDATHFSGTQACASNMFAHFGVRDTLEFGAVRLQMTAQQIINTFGENAILGKGPQATWLEYTGTTPAACSGTGVAGILCLNGNSGSYLWDFTIADLWIFGGTTNAVDAISAADVQHSEFRNVYTWGVTGCGIDTMGAVTDTFYRTRSSGIDATEFNIATGHSSPAHGLCFGGLSGIATTDGTVIDAAAEGTTSVGWLLTDAVNMTFTSGTSEQNASGLEVDSPSGQNTFITNDFEGNTNHTDIFDNGTGDQYIGVTAGDTTQVTCGASVAAMTIIGGNLGFSAFSGCASTKISAMWRNGAIQPAGVPFASLPASPQNAWIIYCTDCTIANPCASGGTGAFAKREENVWVCN